MKLMSLQPTSLHQPRATSQAQQPFSPNELQADVVTLRFANTQQKPQVVTFNCARSDRHPHLTEELHALHQAFDTLDDQGKYSDMDDDPRVDLGTLYFLLSPEAAENQMTLVPLNVKTDSLDDLQARLEIPQFETIELSDTAFHGVAHSLSHFLKCVLDNFHPHLSSEKLMVGCNLVRYPILPGETIYLPPHHHKALYSGSLLLSDPSETAGGNLLIRPRDSLENEHYVIHPLRQHEMAIWQEDGTDHSVLDTTNTSNTLRYRDVIVFTVVNPQRCDDILGPPLPK